MGTSQFKSLVYRDNQTTPEPHAVLDPSPPPKYKAQDIANLERELLNTFASIGMEEGAILQEVEDAPKAFLEDPRPCVRRLALLHNSLVVTPSNEQRLISSKGSYSKGAPRLTIEVMERPPDDTRFFPKSLQAGVHYIDQRADGDVVALLLPPLTRTTSGAEIRITAGGGSRSLVVVPNPGDMVDDLLVDHVDQVDHPRSRVDPKKFKKKAKPKETNNKPQNLNSMRCFVVRAKCYATLVAVPELSSWYIVGNSHPSCLTAGSLAFGPNANGILHLNSCQPRTFSLSRESYDDWPIRWSE
jgi:hypothetical protein